jgi:hypothetical protein
LRNIALEKKLSGGAGAGAELGGAGDYMGKEQIEENEL